MVTGTPDQRALTSMAARSRPAVAAAFASTTSSNRAWTVAGAPAAEGEGRVPNITGGEGGICGYLTGRTYDITDVDFPLRINVLGCMTLEVIGTGDAWAGSCSEQRGETFVSWTAELAQIWP